MSGLTVGDYLLWNWSLGGNHVALALVSGLSLLPLAGACLLLAVLTLTQALARLTRRPATPTASRGGTRVRRRLRPVRSARRGHHHGHGEPPPSTTPAGRSSSKLAA